ncbi:MAG: hypothetical protein KGZ50_07085 [Peptococcaceae bacterium]|nr:hypothetical protein [Peptococcaceae bacterium]
MNILAALSLRDIRQKGQSPLPPEDGAPGRIMTAKLVSGEIVTIPKLKHHLCLSRVVFL